MRRTSLPLLALVVASCAPAAPPPRKTNSPSSGSAPIATNDDPARASTAKCVEPKLLPSKKRDDGINAYLEGRITEALELLDDAVRSDPRDRGADAFRRATTKKLETRKAAAREEIKTITPIVLEAIPLSRTSKKTIPGLPTAKIRLEKESEKKNLITDNADWEKKNQLTSPHVSPDMAAQVAPSARDRPRTVLKHADHLVAIYTGFILVAGDGRRSVAFDTADLEKSGFTVGFAQVVGGALIVQAGYNGYAKDSKGKNAYLAAFDGGNGNLLWSSDPLVANGHEALVSGGSIITGYGFTAEPDFLFVTDLATGNVDQKISVKSAPEAIRAKGDRVFVRTYDVDYVFKSAGPIAAAPPANLTKFADAATAVDPDVRCFVRMATGALVTRDRASLKNALEGLSSRTKDHQLVEFLKNEEASLEADRRLDLLAAPLQVMPAPAWEAAPGTPVKTVVDPKLVKVKTAKADPVRNMNPVFAPDKPWFIAPARQGAVPQGARSDIPTSYGQEDLRAIIPSGSKTLLIYGGRYLAITRAGQAERMFDLETFRNPPKANPQWKEFAVEDVTYAQELDGVLYVCNGGGSYAREVFGKKGFLSAIEVASGKLLWRSPPLTCNSTFAISGAHIISGYGFTEEPDFVFLVRRADGTIAQKVPIDSGPDTITLEGNKVHVETYGHAIDFELR